MTRITEKEIKKFELPNRQMTIRETVIWNEVNRREMKQAMENRAELHRSYVFQKSEIL